MIFKNTADLSSHASKSGSKTHMLKTKNFKKVVSHKNLMCFEMSMYHHMDITNSLLILFLADKIHTCHNLPENTVSWERLTQVLDSCKANYTWFLAALLTAPLVLLCK